MAKPAVYEPAILDYMRAHPQGVTVSELATAVGCSRQQVYKVVGKGAAIGIQVAGRSDTGADILVWSGNHLNGDGAGPNVQGDVPRVGTMFRVVSTIETENGVEVVLRSDRGEESVVTYH